MEMEEKVSLAKMTGNFSPCVPPWEDYTRTPGTGCIACKTKATCRRRTSSRISFGPRTRIDRRVTWSRRNLCGFDELFSRIEDAREVLFVLVPRLMTSRKRNVSSHLLSFTNTSTSFLHVSRLRVTSDCVTCFSAWFVLSSERALR